MFWSSRRFVNATNRSDGLQRHIKASRSVQNDAVVAPGGAIERNDLPRMPDGRLTGEGGVSVCRGGAREVSALDGTSRGDYCMVLGTSRCFYVSLEAVRSIGGIYEASW